MLGRRVPRSHHLLPVPGLLLVMLPVITIAGLPAPGQPASQPDQSTPAAALASIYDAIDHDEHHGAMSGLLFLPLTLRADEQALLADRLAVGSQLHDLLEEKFDPRSAQQVNVRAQVPFIPRLDAAKMRWQTQQIDERTRSLGIDQVVEGRAGPAGRSVTMLHFPEGWRLKLPMTTAPELAMQLEDEPWRTRRVQRVLDDCRAGKFDAPADVLDALVLHGPPTATRPASVPVDRTTPQGAISVLERAVDAGDVAAVADSYVFLREADRGAARRAWAERVVVNCQLQKALDAKFGPERAKHLASRCGLSPFIAVPPVIRWVIDGDVARAAFDHPRYATMYRMVRQGGAWRIQVPWPGLPRVGPLRPREEDEQDARMQRWTERKKQVLAHLDRYPTPGSIVDELDVARAMDAPVDRAALAKQAEDEALALRRKLATQPAPKTRDDELERLKLSLTELSAAMIKQDAPAAARIYYANSDHDGAYAVARQRRALATMNLMERAAREIDSGAMKVAYELMLVDLADDPLSLAMIDWKFDGDRAVGTVPEGMGAAPLWIPRLTKVAGEWKIDVTDETDRDPGRAARRADDEATKLGQIEQRVKQGDFKTLDRLKDAIRAAGISGPARPM